MAVERMWMKWITPGVWLVLSSSSVFLSTAKNGMTRQYGFCG
jgi:hypothetical protein